MEKKTNLGVALVTGASYGIGHATAKALQNAGFRVFGSSRRALAERSDGVTMLSCDVTDDALTSRSMCPASASTSSTNFATDASLANTLSATNRTSSAIGEHDFRITMKTSIFCAWRTVVHAARKVSRLRMERAAESDIHLLKAAADPE